MSDCSLATYVAIFILAILLLLSFQGGREGFTVTPEARAVYSASQPLFDRRGAETKYSEFKRDVGTVYPGVDVALFTDTKRSWEAAPKEYSPERVQALL